MSDDVEYQIEFSIQRRKPGGGDFEEIGFGSSGSWGEVDAALYAIQSIIQNRQWETEKGMPDPALLDRI